MKYIALLLGLLVATPAMAQNTNNSGRKDSPSTQGPSTKRQDPNRQGQNGRGATPRRGGGIDPGLLRRFDTNGDGRLSNEEKAAARRRIAQWRNRNRGNDPRGGDRGSRGGRGNDPKPGSRGSRGSRGNGPRPQPGAGGNGNGPKPQPGRGSRGSRGNGPRPQPGAGGNGNGPRPKPGARGSRGSRGNGPKPKPAEWEHWQAAGAQLEARWDVVTGEC